MKSKLNQIINKESKVLFISNPKPGMGVINRIQNSLKEANKEYTHVPYWLTSVDFFKLVKENNDKLIILDEADDIMYNPEICTMIKALMEGECVYTSLYINETITFSGEFIIVLSRINDYNLSPFISRGAITDGYKS